MLGGMNITTTHLWLPQELEKKKPSLLAIVNSRIVVESNNKEKTIKLKTNLKC